MRLITYNILEGGTGRIDPLAEVIRLADADVAVLQETWDEALFHKLADRLGMDRFLAENPRNPRGAVGLLSRLRIREAVNHTPLEPLLSRAAFTARVESPVGPPLDLLGLHLHARETLADEAARLKELAALFEIAAKLPPAHLLAGDFNATHPAQSVDLAKARPKTRARVAEQNHQLPRDAIAQVLARGYVDAHALHRPPAEFHTTFTTSHPVMRVDYIFATKEMVPRMRSCEAFKPEMARFASDHFPMIVVIE